MYLTFKSLRHITTKRCPQRIVSCAFKSLHVLTSIVMRKQYVFPCRICYTELLFIFVSLFKSTHYISSMSTKYNAVEFCSCCTPNPLHSMIIQQKVGMVCQNFLCFQCEEVMMEKMRKNEWRIIRYIQANIAYH